jgi:hypothetical protein
MIILSKRWLNGAVGFCTGSAAYYVFLFAATLMPWTRSNRCYYGSMGYWWRIVAQTNLHQRMQPHYLYLCAPLAALIFIRWGRPFNEDVPFNTNRVAALCWSFCSIVALNLWFALSVGAPRFLHL